MDYCISFTAVYLDVYFLHSFYDHILIMVPLPRLSRSVISLSWPSCCFLLTFLRLFDAMISYDLWIDFLMSCFAFFLVLPISAYSIRCFLHRFFTTARVGEDIVDFKGLLIALATYFVISTLACF